MKIDNKKIFLIEALKSLIIIIKEFHNKNIILLIDEYDAPFNYQLEHELGLHNKLIKEILTLLGAIFSNVVKDN